MKQKCWFDDNERSMTRTSGIRLLVAITTISLVTLGSPAAGEEAHAETDKLPASQAIQALKKGGYVIFMRHTPTDTSTLDQVDEVALEQCSLQRNLTAEGRFRALEIGKAIRRLHIPLGELLASPYCRTMETAELAFGKYVVSHGLTNTANLTDQEKTPIVAELRNLLGRPVLTGSNRILVSHSSTLADATGIFPKPEGVVLIFRPDGKGGFRHIATIVPTDWGKIGTPRR